MDAAGTVDTAPVPIEPILSKLGLILLEYGKRPYPVDSFEPLMPPPGIRGMHRRLALQYSVAWTERFLPEWVATEAVFQ